MNIKFIDTSKEYFKFKDEISSRWQRITESGIFLFGQETLELESKLPSLIGKNYGVTVKNCTDAIMLVLRKIFKPGMVVILPNFGAYPTPVAVRNFTDQIYYVDVDETLTIDPDKLPLNIKNGIIIPVHLFGNNCDMHKIMQYAKQNNHIVIEDCAQSTGSGSGGDGDFSVFSFYPTKPLSSMGDGGMICFNDESCVDFFKRERFYGQEGSWIYRPGINSRMDEFQAAVVNSKFNYFIELNNKRIENACRYNKILKGFKSRGCVYHQYVALFNEREYILAKLKQKNIPYMIHYMNHLSEIPSIQGIYNHVGLRLNDKAISLPVHPYLEEEQLLIIEEFLNEVKDYEYNFNKNL